MEHRATRWLAPSLTTLPLSARRCRVRNVLNGATAESSADQTAVLTACDGCRTIDEHAVVIQRKLGLRDTERTTLTQWLGDFASLRRLISLDELRQRFASPAVSTAAPFAGIAIRTCDRPALLNRALASAASLERRLGSRYHYIVLDDSRDTAHRAQNARTVTDVAL